MNEAQLIEQLDLALAQQRSGEFSAALEKFERLESD
jgi:hypothetical protein